MLQAALRKLTYDDLARMPDDGLRRELLDGELFVTPAPAPLHQRVSKRLLRQLEHYFERRGLGEVFIAPLDVILGRHDVPQPDLLVVTREGLITDRAVEGAPTLVVEVLSASTARVDRTLKSARYAAAGVAFYWTVDPRRHRIECRRLHAKRYIAEITTAEGDRTLTLPDWPGLRIDLAKLWAPAPSLRPSDAGRGRRPRRGRRSGA